MSIVPASTTQADPRVHPGIGGLGRVRLVFAPTPLEPMDRLAATLGLPDGTLWVKRDDMTGLAGGGNKARKLEYLCAEAVQLGCDHLVTGAGVQSNHVRMTAAAAATLGMGATVLLQGREPSTWSGNLVLDCVLGAEIRFVGAQSFEAAEAGIRAETERLTAAGKHPYAVPVGGSIPLGSLGYVEAVAELCSGLGVPPDLVVVATGSAGTHAGLAAGLGSHDAVMGVRVGVREDLCERVEALAAEAASMAGLPAPVGRCATVDDQLGGGYGRPTAAAAEAIHLAARTEGLLLDPVYTGKAMAGLIAACRSGRIRRGMRVVFVHTGGLPGLLAEEPSAWITTA